MTHLVTLQGSARRRGNTATVLNCFEEAAGGLASAGMDLTIDHIEVGQARLEPCRGCTACQKVFSEPGCRRKDEALAIFERMRAADLLIYATPLYCWDFSSHMKLLIDRHYCLTKWRAPGGRRSLLEGKRAALLVTCGDEIENNADLIQVIFEREMDCLDIRVVGKYILPGCSDAGHPGARAETLARRMAAELLGAPLFD